MPTDMESKFDFVICADCLFFDEFRSALKECFKTVLAPGGLAIVTAPRRGETYGDFQRLVQEDPGLKIIDDLRDYSPRITAVRDRIQKDGKFDENIHYPRLFTFRKKYGDDRDK